jgi:hypothetical protein
MLRRGTAHNCAEKWGKNEKTLALRVGTPPDTLFLFRRTPLSSALSNLCMKSDDFTMHAACFLPHVCVLLRSFIFFIAVPP